MPSANETTCRSCGARIWFLRQAEPDIFDPLFGTVTKGEVKPGAGLNPIEVAVAEKGNVAVDVERGTYHIVPKDRRAGRPLHLSHFARCEQARQHSKKGRR